MYLCIFVVQVGINTALLGYCLSKLTSFDFRVIVSAPNSRYDFLVVISGGDLNSGNYGYCFLPVVYSSFIWPSFPYATFYSAMEVSRSRAIIQPSELGSLCLPDSRSSQYKNKVF